MISRGEVIDGRDAVVWIDQTALHGLAVGDDLMDLGLPVPRIDLDGLFLVAVEAHQGREDIVEGDTLLTFSVEGIGEELIRIRAIARPGFPVADH